MNLKCLGSSESLSITLSFIFDALTFWEYMILSVVTWLVVNLQCEFPLKAIDWGLLPQAVITEDNWVCPHVCRV